MDGKLSLTLGEEHILRVFENRVKRRIFGAMRDEIIGSWGEEPHDFYSSPNIIRMIRSRRMRWSGNVARMGEKRGAYRVLVGKLERKRPLGRLRRRWEYNV
jgi:hypothetical protein